MTGIRGGSRAPIVPASPQLQESDHSSMPMPRPEDPAHHPGKEVRGRPITAASPSGSARNSQISNGPGKIVDTATSAAESSTFQSGSSVRAVHDIISRFDDAKKKLVQSIGFGSLLKFPLIKSTNRKLSGWLMGGVDVKHSCLSLPDGTTLPFYSQDLELVFGIPSEGKPISDTVHLEKEAKEKVKLQCWPHTGRENQSIKAVEGVIDCTYKTPMTSEEEDAFKVAFVVFMMSTLFVPGAKRDYACVDYWGALYNPGIIHEFNWAAYIHKKILAAASKYRSDIETGSRAPIITGCSLFLQVFYLDNIDIPQWAVDPTIRPRISAFTTDRLRNMIAADTVERRDPKSNPVYGNTQIKPRAESCYTWAQPELDRPMDAYTQSTTSLWRSVLSLITMLGIPLEAAGPLYLAASELNRPSEASSPLSGIDCVAILLRIVEPFRKGFNYNFHLQPHGEGLGGEGGPFDLPEVLRHYCAGTEYAERSMTGNCRSAASVVCDRSSTSQDLTHMIIGALVQQGCSHKQPPKRPRLAPSHPPAEHIGGPSQQKLGEIDYTVARLMARFYLLLRCARERIRLDLNTFSVETDPCHGLHATNVVPVVGEPKTPWELGDRWGYDSVDSSSFPDNFIADGDASNGASFSMPGIVDYHPKYIEVLPIAAHDQLTGLSEIDMDMFDAILRCFKHSDNALYSSESRLRWRHFFESDILAGVLAGWFDIHNPSMRYQFNGAHLGYNLRNCNMLFFPVILHERWVCFSWNLKHNSIVVFDPSCMNIPGFSVRSTYKRVADMLKNTFSTTIPHLLPGWQHDWNGAPVLPFHWRDAGMECSNRTGVLCAYFCRCFDGVQLQPDITQAHIELMARKLFGEVKAVHTRRLTHGPRGL